MSLADGIRARRSIRGLDGPPLSAEEVEALVELALLAPAPHHTTPWRFAEVTPARRAALARAMGEVWGADMTADDVPEAQQARALDRSRRRVEGAPTLLLGCIVGDGLAAYPDERRDRAEWTMAAHSFGAALQNLLLEASALGLGAYWMAAPLYAQDSVRDVLDLPDGWRPQALVALGRPRADYEPFDRPAPDVGGSLIRR
ncbi:MAG: nitroreductase family protein [Chloroflexota bacterium]|nr:nitroreductase family protein [Chloroflexota bacterium]